MSEMETDQPPEYDTNNNDSKPTTPVPELIEQEDFVMVPDIPGAEEAKAEGNAFYKTQEYRKALEKYQEAHKLYPTHHTYLGNIAATYLALQNYRDALLASQDACRLDSTYVKGYSRQIKCQIYLGQGAAARSVMNEAEKHLMDASLEVTFGVELAQLATLERNLELAKNAEDKKDFRQSQFFYKQATEIAPGSTLLKMKQAESMALGGTVPEAQAMTIRVLQKDQRDSFALYSVLKMNFETKKKRFESIFFFNILSRSRPLLLPRRRHRQSFETLHSSPTNGPRLLES